MSLIDWFSGVNGDKTINRQLGFDLPAEPRFARSLFHVSPANADALALVELWPRWPDSVLLVCGPAGSGKSHLARIWSLASHAASIKARDLRSADLSILAQHPALVLENADSIGAGEAELFHLLNLTRERKGWLMLTASSMPDQWGLATPDLLSRLRLAPSVAIAAPDDQTVRSVLVKNLKDRQLAVDAGVIDYVLLRMERSFAAARLVAAMLDREALARGTPVTRTIASAVLAEVYGQDDLFEPE